MVALVVGKSVGITGSTLLALRLRVGLLAGDIRRGQLVGGATLAGIGFTMALFIAGLAFGDDHLNAAGIAGPEHEVGPVRHDGPPGHADSDAATAAGRAVATAAGSTAPGGRPETGPASPSKAPHAPERRATATAGQRNFDSAA